MSRRFDRRSFLLSAAAVATASMLPLPARAALPDSCSVTPPKLTADPQVAISLKAISAQLRKCGRSACAEARQMGGMTRLDGFLVDRAAQDIVLWGAAEAGEPRLVIEDFLVALRAAYWRYPVTENGKKVHYRPGISLDADPKVFLELNKGYDYDDPASIARYKALCASSYNYVRVDGMPRDTRVADVLLAADYKMKMVVSGREQLAIRDPFPSVYENRLQIAALRRERGVLDREDHVVGTRFWFSAGQFSYQVSPGSDTGFLETAQIILQDRSQQAKQGGVVDGGATDPITRAFTCAWTDRMEETFTADPLWAEMRNMFRHFAIAQIIGRSDLLAAARFDGSYLLDSHLIPKVPLRDAVPGVWIANEQETWTHYYCGGVSVGFDDANLRRAAEDGAVSDSRHRIVAARPRRDDTIAWKIG